jgi:putative transcriptional regulator
VSETPANLAGQLLIAEPRLSDPNFRRSVVLVLAHDAEGALGVVLNRPTEVPACEVVEELALLVDASDMLHDGGPVQRDGVVVLADFAEPEESERLVVGSVGMLSDLSEPERLSESVRRVRAFAGYAGWGAGQLEGELQREDWFLEPARVDDVFSAAPGKLWSSVLERKGGSYRLVSRMPEDPSLN